MCLGGYRDPPWLDTLLTPGEYRAGSAACPGTRMPGSIILPEDDLRGLARLDHHPLEHDRRARVHGDDVATGIHRHRLAVDDAAADEEPVAVPHVERRLQR